jgi:hypothetical protein
MLKTTYDILRVLGGTALSKAAPKTMANFRRKLTNLRKKDLENLEMKVETKKLKGELKDSKKEKPVKEGPGALSKAKDVTIGGVKYSIDKISKLLGTTPFQVNRALRILPTQYPRLAANVFIGDAALKEYAPGTRDQIIKGTRKGKDVVKKGLTNMEDFLYNLSQKDGGGIGTDLKKIPAGPKGAGLRALKKENPSLVREQFKYAKKGGKILAKKKKKKKVKYVGVGKALRGYGSVRRG